MAVAHDGEANLSQAYSFVGSVTVTGKTTAGSDRVAVGHLAQSFGAAITGVTYGGSGMTAGSTVGGGGVQGAHLYYFVAPPTGATNLVASFGDDDDGAFGASSYNGVDQTTPRRTNSNDTGTGVGSPATVTCDPSAVGDVVVDCVSSIDGQPVLGANQVSLFNTESSGGSGRWGAGSREAGAATVTMSWTGVGDWAIASMSLQAAAAAESSSVSPSVSPSASESPSPSASAAAAMIWGRMVLDYEDD